MKFLNDIYICILHFLVYRSSLWTCKLNINCSCCFVEQFYNWLKFIYLQETALNTSISEKNKYFEVVFNQNYLDRNLSWTCLSIFIWKFKLFFESKLNFVRIFWETVRIRVVSRGSCLRTGWFCTEYSFALSGFSLSGFALDV